MRPLARRAFEAILEQGATMKGHEKEVFNHLPLLQTPQVELKEPLLIEAEKLGGERIYLCANEGQAQEIEQAEGVCYLPGEIRSLLSNSAAMNEDSLRDYLGKIHEIKKVFRGSRIDR